MNDREIVAARRALNMFGELSEVLRRAQPALGRFARDDAAFNAAWVEAENRLREVAEPAAQCAARKLRAATGGMAGED